LHNISRNKHLLRTLRERVRVYEHCMNLIDYRFNLLEFGRKRNRNIAETFLDAFSRCYFYEHFSFAARVRNAN